jgi:cation diffusion facilitator CzcD-associated flavoprotein CzcO
MTYDVVIVGAGLSGIGAACHLERECPGKSYVILEAREAMGGTWDVFRYPGIRSDSDMFTLGYRFRPWEAAEAIADGPSIRRYIEETAREYGVDRRIRYGHRVLHAAWSTPEALWTVEVAGAGQPFRGRFLFWCSGYYSYESPFSPHFEGVERFQGQVVHPQHWPEDLDWTGKRVVVVGSGATAVTLVPALADRAAHVTMLQRSPSYILSLPGSDPMADRLRRRLPSRAVYALVRWRNIARQTVFYKLSRRYPERIKRLLRKWLEHQLPPEFDIDMHFTPRYEPWDQRLCLVPDGDLFAALRSGRASIVTDRLETFTARGLRLASGDELETDLVVTATGLNLQLLGGATIVVDGREISPSDAVAYKAAMLSGVPNMALTVGYTNASWTLKADLVSEFVCRLLRHMDAHGYRYCVARAPDPREPRQPFLDLKSGYVLRAVDTLPKQGSRVPWRVHQNYFRDLRMFRRAPLEDEGIVFSRDGIRPGSRALDPALLTEG